MKLLRLWFVVVLPLVSPAAIAQSTAAAITGVVNDEQKAVITGAHVTAINTQTDVKTSTITNGSGQYVIPALPPGSYRIEVDKEGFKGIVEGGIALHVQDVLQLNFHMAIGSMSETVTVEASGLNRDQTDTATGYIVDQATIQQTPLGTGSFTQLAIMSPGVHADFLGGGGTDAGLGNRAIFANGQRDTSNGFSMNGINTNNLFSGNTSSEVGENRYIDDTGGAFGAGGAIVTSTSVYNAIGQALPTPAPETIQEVAVTSAMYDASQGEHSGAHIAVLTQSGTKELHGQLYEKFQNSVFNAAPYFYNASPIITQKVPFMNRNQFGATVGGPITKSRIFYFLGYQGIRIADETDASRDVTVPLGLTDDRSAQGISNAIQNSFGSTPSAISPQALALLQAKLPNGKYFIPSAQITDPSTAINLGYDAIVQAPNATATTDQAVADVDFAMSDKDRLMGKYFYQTNPTADPFSTADVLLGFPQTLSSGSQVVSLVNSWTLTPNLLWQQWAGFTRMRAYAGSSGQALSPTDAGINLVDTKMFPEFKLNTADPTIAGAMQFGPNVNFGNAGMYQNDWEYGTTLNWGVGRHTLSFGMAWDRTQLNIENNNTATDFLNFKNFETFVEGVVRSGEAWNGGGSRYYRANTAGVFVNDDYKMLSNLDLTVGLRWDLNGAFSEKYGRLTAFNPQLYSYDASSDTIVNDGLEVAGNNAAFGTSGANDTLLNQRQWGFAPRFGVAYSPTTRLTIRSGVGLYYDRGEYFTEFSPPAGGTGASGPFEATVAPPFVFPVYSAPGATLAGPFGSTVPPPPVSSSAQFQTLLPNIGETISGNYPPNNTFGPFLFGGYAMNNKLPYAENWMVDVQYQPASNWLFTLGYLGNHSQHLVLAIPFNEPILATPNNPVNGQIYSYGGMATTALDLEPISTFEFAGNAPVRVPYVGYDMNSLQYEAVGISNYDALEVQAHERLSNGLQFTAAYTWSHALDEQSASTVYNTGNNPNSPRGSYASADFDQPNVFIVNYSYSFPRINVSRVAGKALNGWTLAGQSVAQSGTPYSVYDYSGSVGSLYFGSDIAENPIVPLSPGVSAKQARLQGTIGVNPNKPVINMNDFRPPFVTPGTDGVPPCDAAGCDVYESTFGSTGRNMFRAPFQTRFDLSLAKSLALTERCALRFNADAFNAFNHPDFDAPNNQVFFFPYYAPPPVYPPAGSGGIIQHTIGSPRFLQLSAHLTF